MAACLLRRRRKCCAWLNDSFPPSDRWNSEGTLQVVSLDLLLIAGKGTKQNALQLQHFPSKKCFNCTTTIMAARCSKALKCENDFARDICTKNLHHILLCFFNSRNFRRSEYQTFDTCQASAVACQVLAPKEAWWPKWSALLSGPVFPKKKECSFVAYGMCVQRERGGRRRRKPAIFVCGLIHNVACLRSIKEEREKGVCGRLFLSFCLFHHRWFTAHELRSIGTEKGKSEKYFLLCTSTFLPAFWTKEFFALKVFCQGFSASIK